MVERRFIKVFIFLLFILNALSAFSQIDIEDFEESTKTDSTFTSAEWIDENDSIEIYYYTGNIINNKLNKLTYIDTTITEAFQYDNLYKHNKIYSTLSNIGLAHISLNYIPNLSDGFSKSLFYFKEYLVTNDEVRYYKLSKPYTELFYVLGAKKEQNLKLVFSRDLFKGLNVGINFSFEYSPGSYKNTNINNMKGYVYSQYVTPNKRFNFILNYVINKLRLNENGGITDDKYFTENLENDRSVIPVNLIDADNSIKESSVFFQNQFNLSKAKSENDSTNKRIDLGSLNYSFQYKKNTYQFTDPDPLSEFYQSFAAPIDSNQTFDSTSQEFFINKIGWTSLGYNKDVSEKPFYIYANLNYNNIKELLPYDSFKSSWNQLGVSGGLGITIKKSFYLTGKGYIFFSGYNQGDFGIKGSINQYIGNKYKNYGEVILGADFSLVTPWRFYQHWNSNRFRWINNFNKESYFILSGKYKYKSINTGVNFYTIGNYTYLNDSVKPQQAEKALTILQFFFEGIIPIKKFGFDTKLVYQTASQTDIVRIPQFTGTLNAYFKSPVFKKAATVQLGMQLRYFSSFYANSYMPELRAFYLQNDVKIGNYLWADVYITLKIQRARLFFKMANVTGYFEGYSYFLTPHYPDRDPRFYFGISWRFHD
jgi:hypothetical protein